MTAGLELRGVTYRYPAVRHPALDDISFVVEPGMAIGLVGPNESGKSTLCLVAAGLAPASIGGDLRGDVLVDGTALRGLRPWEVAARVGIVFAEPASQLSGVAGTVFEEVALGPVNLGLPRDESIARTERALDRLGIAGLAERAPDRLSGGQQQLVAIASILAMEPPVLVLDEPSAELDTDARRRVADALNALTREGAAVLVTENDVLFLREARTRIGTIYQGKVSL
jgi:energy-coupling factor transport system ATP-binding protein